MKEEILKETETKTPDLPLSAKGHNVITTYQPENSELNDSSIQVAPIKLLNKDAKIPVYSTELAAGCDFYSPIDAILEPPEIIGLKPNPEFSISKPIHPEKNPYYLETKFNDLEAVRTTVKHNTITIKTGIAIQLEPDEELELRSRSGLAVKLDILAFNGTIDADYTGEIAIKLWNMSTQPFHIEKGMRIAQGVIKKVIQKQFKVVDELQKTKRGDKGFGSTALK